MSERWGGDDLIVYRVAVNLLRPGMPGWLYLFLDHAAVFVDYQGCIRKTGNSACLKRGAAKRPRHLRQIGISCNFAFPAHRLGPSSIRTGLSPELSYSTHAFTRCLYTELKFLQPAMITTFGSLLMASIDVPALDRSPVLKPGASGE